MAGSRVKRTLLVVAAAAALMAPGAASAGSQVELRHIDFGSFPLVRVTALVPAGARPVLLENGHGAAFAKARQLGSAEALMLALDNSESMTGRPLREAKAAAQEFLSHDQRGRPRRTDGDVSLRRDRLVGLAATENVDGHTHPRPADGRP
jgi:hypothetical protein